MIPTFFQTNFRLKAVAFVTAFFVWIFVNDSITETKTLTAVPVRIIHIPQDKTIKGILPTGYMSNRLTLTLRGNRRVIEDLESGDLEVMIDGANFDHDEWPIVITKKNLLSLNPDVDLKRHIASVEHPDWTIRLEPLVTAQVPVTVRAPIGDVPSGFEVLDIFPHTLKQTVTGPKADVEKLKNKGIKLSFDLAQLSHEELNKAMTGDDEIYLLPPDSSKIVAYQLDRPIIEKINDPRSDQLRIDFLKKSFLPLEANVPVVLYYPQKTIETINPYTVRLREGRDLEESYGVFYLKEPLFVKDVSKTFLDFIRNQIQIVIIASPKNDREHLLWSVEVISPQSTEDAFVASQIGRLSHDTITPHETKEKHLRKRFWDYLEKLELWQSPEKKLHVTAMLDDKSIRVEVR